MDIIDNDFKICLASFNTFFQFINFFLKECVVLFFEFYLIGEILNDLFAFLM